METNRELQKVVRAYHEDDNLWKWLGIKVGEHPIQIVHQVLDSVPRVSLVIDVRQKRSRVVFFRSHKVYKVS